MVMLIRRLSDESGDNLPNYGSDNKEKGCCDLQKKNVQVEKARKMIRLIGRKMYKRWVY